MKRPPPMTVMHCPCPVITTRKSTRHSRASRIKWQATCFNWQRKGAKRTNRNPQGLLRLCQHGAGQSTLFGAWFDDLCAEVTLDKLPDKPPFSADGKTRVGCDHRKFIQWKRNASSSTKRRRNWLPTKSKSSPSSCNKAAHHNRSLSEPDWIRDL
jgi:hypothetical protein